MADRPVIMVPKILPENSYYGRSVLSQFRGKYLNPQPVSSKPQGIISSLLAPACAAWLRTQVSEVASLDVQIAAKDRQVLSGTIPNVAIVATQAVYRGISLQKINLLADQITVNLSQVMRGKPLRLLQPIAIEIEATISNADLLSSLTAPLLSEAVQQLIAQATALPVEDWSLVWHSVKIHSGNLTLHGDLQRNDIVLPINICAGITLLEGHIIYLAPLVVDCELLIDKSITFDGTYQTSAQPYPDTCLAGRKAIESYSIDLGNEVNLRELVLGSGELYCAGQVQIRP
jgi:LmeA-like phospholipid-binding